MVEGDLNPVRCWTDGSLVLDLRMRIERRRAAHTEHGYQAHTLPDLFSDLATLCRNTLRIGPSEHTFTRLTTPTKLQATALELLGTKLKT